MVKKKNTSSFQGRVVPVVCSVKIFFDILPLGDSPGQQGEGVGLEEWNKGLGVGGRRSGDSDVTDKGVE